MDIDPKHLNPQPFSPGEDSDGYNGPVPTGMDPPDTGWICIDFETKPRVCGIVDCRSRRNQSEAAASGLREESLRSGPEDGHGWATAPTQNMTFSIPEQEIPDGRERRYDPDRPGRSASAQSLG